eukprot:2177383-Rhodomonas_salina.1
MFRLACKRHADSAPILATTPAALFLLHGTKQDVACEDCDGSEGYEEQTSPDHYLDRVRLFARVDGCNADVRLGVELAGVEDGSKQLHVDGAVVWFSSNAHQVDAVPVANKSSGAKLH